MTTENKDSKRAAGGPGMSLSRFAALAEAYGAEFDRWPENERFSAISLCGRSEEARVLLADAHEVDMALLRLDTPPSPSTSLRERIATLQPEPIPTVPNSFAVAASIGRGAAFAMATAAGLYAGLLLAPPGTVRNADLGLIEAALIVGEAPSMIVGELMEDD